MADIKATNNYVFVIRDKTEAEKSGLIIPTAGKVKPHTGKIISVGGLVKDMKLKNGKDRTAIFHQTVGQEIEYDGITYLVLMDNQIIGLV